MFMFLLDPTYMLVILGLIITLFAQGKMTSTFSKYSKVKNKRGLTGKEAAEQIIQSQGLTGVTVRHVKGNLSDHYDPRTKTVNLSDATYNQTSVAAIGVAAHEVGHALQHQNGYVPLRLRTAIIPVANIGSMAAMPLILIGLLFNSEMSATLINLGIIGFAAAVVFQIVTLPVEFNASRRAVGILDSSGILMSDEIAPTKKVLGAAALTYVAAVAASLLQLLRLVLIARSRD